MGYRNLHRAGHRAEDRVGHSMAGSAGRNYIPIRDLDSERVGSLEVGSPDNVRDTQDKSLLVYWCIGMRELDENRW